MDVKVKQRLIGLHSETEERGAEKRYVFLCLHGVTDVRRNVWVARSLRSPIGAPLPPSPTRHLQPNRIEERLSGVKRGPLRQAPLPRPPSVDSRSACQWTGGSIRVLE